MNRVAKEMDKILKQGKAENWNPSQYRAGLHSMLSQMRQKLRFGETDLYIKIQSPTNRK